MASEGLGQGSCGHSVEYICEEMLVLFWEPRKQAPSFICKFVQRSRGAEREGKELVLEWVHCEGHCDMVSGLQVKDNVYLGSTYCNLWSHKN